MHSIHKKLPAFALLGAFALAGCTADSGPTQKFVDGCKELPASCGGVYSADGRYLAFLSPAGHDRPDQVFRVDLYASGAQPELISMSADGQPADGACREVSFARG